MRQMLLCLLALLVTHAGLAQESKVPEDVLTMIKGHKAFKEFQEQFRKQLTFELLGNKIADSTKPYVNVLVFAKGPARQTKEGETFAVEGVRCFLV
ncbi:MAG: hypothetical protein EOP49_06025, partial [Sphingobacteriales bacterium]